MTTLLPNIPNPSQSPNEVLAHQIAQALLTAGFISALEEEDVLKLLTTGNTRAGDWLQLLEKNIYFDSSPTNIDHATTDHAA